MGSPPVQLADALDKLVHQFADPLAFFRELIQNALDAGSHEVEIRLGFKVDADADPDDADPPGVAVWTITDWGEGMDRPIIERRLTRLFASAKGDDRTKIGKFGIGFVSVFAIEPAAVIVDTARAGEAWRVIFRADTRYELRRLEEAVEGTTIRVLKPLRRAAHEALAARARQVIAFWCRHCEGEIRVDGVDIGEPLDVAVALKIRERSEHAEIVVGHASDGSTFFGLYNRGLTLVEAPLEDDLRGLHVKISSPHLEHTLTRDDVIRDRAYARVLARARAVVHGPLCERSFAAVAERIAAGQRVSAEAYRALAWHIGRPPRPEGVVALPIARAPSGATVTLTQLFEAVGGGRPPLLTRVRSHLSDHLEAAGHVVLLANPDAPVLPLVTALGAYARVRDRYCMPLGPTLSRQEVARWRPLTRAAMRLLAASGAKIKALVLGHFDYPESAIAERVAIVQDEPWSLSELDRVAAFKDGLFARRQTLVVNADHPTVADLVRLSQREPEQAGYMLAKSFLVRGDELDAEVDGELLRRALEMRCQRQTG